MNTKIDIKTVESIFIPRGSKIEGFILGHSRKSLVWISMRDGNRWTDAQIDVIAPNGVFGQLINSPEANIRSGLVPDVVIDSILTDPWLYAGVVVTRKGTKQKPDVVKLVRYVRPVVVTQNGNWVIDNMRGATLLISLNYITKTISFQYSICRGDNFDKGVGVAEARGRDVITIPMQGDGISRNGVVHDIMAYLQATIKITPSLRDLVKTYSDAQRY